MAKLPSGISNHPVVQAAKLNSAGQGTTLMLMLVILVLVVARSSTALTFFKNIGTNAGTSISNAAHGNASANKATAASTLDWHYFIYWGIAALLMVMLSAAAPTFTNTFLGLIILEQLLVHWSTYAKFLSIPTK
jgi:hypothetical protein